MKGLNNMETISKVIRIELDCDIFYNEISSDLTEWWRMRLRLMPYRKKNCFLP